MNTLTVRGYTLHTDWFCGARSMEAFAYAIESVLNIKTQLKGGSISDGYDNFPAENIKVNLDGIYSSVMIAQCDIAGSTTCSETGKIYLTKKEVKEYLKTLNFFKPVTIKL